MRRLYEERQRALLAAARQELAARLELRPAASGMHLVGWLPDRSDDAEIARRAIDAGLMGARLSYSSRSHSVKKNVAPLSTDDSAQIRPPWRATIRPTVARPIPVPSNSARECRRWNALNSLPP